ncbi:cell division protein PerM [Saccharopolyspora rosea]|uniref:cell division protein PerM n=1 Tax=Saccharopolyspora rosea TaxID=524884 RepID=UPI0021D8B81B|nr:DUF6350 family protein [Saccharopolyspora rosea]
MPVLDSIPRPTADAATPRRSGVRRWLFVAVLAAVLLLGYLLAVVLIALVVGTATAARFDPLAVLVAGLPGWLALNQVPLTVDGGPLGVLPLLPTVGEMSLVAVGSALVARRSRLRRPDQAWPVIATTGLVHAVVGAVIAVLLRGPVSAVPADAFLGCGLIATLAATAGLANRCGLVYLLWERVDDAVWSGLRVGLMGLAAVVAAGGAVLFVALCWSAPDVVEVLARLGTAGNAFGATLVTLLYLPNAVLAGWSFATGSGVSVGAVTAQPLHADPGPVPDLPLLALLPSDGARLWWILAFALPVAVGTVIGRASRRGTRCLVTAGVATGVVAFGALVLAGIAGGEFGTGRFGPVTLRPGLLVVLTLFWVGLPATAVAWFTAEPDEEDLAEEPEPAEDDPDEAAAPEEPGGTEEVAAEEPADDEPGEDEPHPVEVETAEIDPGEFDLDRPAEGPPGERE